MTKGRDFSVIGPWSLELCKSPDPRNSSEIPPPSGIPQPRLQECVNHPIHDTDGGDVMTRFKAAVVACLALAAGFVGGIWFIASGFGFQLLPTPPLASAPAPAPKPIPKVPFRPRAKAEAVPETAKFSYGSGGLRPLPDRADLLPAPGCTWEIEPRRLEPNTAWHFTNPERALGGFAAVDLSDNLRYLLVQSTRAGTSALNLRPVFFDEEAHRYVPRYPQKGASHGADGVFVMTQFTLFHDEEFSASKMAYFGIEYVVPNAENLLIQAAQTEAREKGMAILPGPRLGLPYEFDLPTVDGKTVRSADLHGKVVVVVVFGPNTAGRIALLRARMARQSTKGDDLAIVGVSFEGSADDARDSFKTSGAEAPLVLVPNNREARRIWTEGAAITRLPAIFILDRAGTLRYVAAAATIQDQVDILLGRLKRPRLQPSIGIRRHPAPDAPPGLPVSPPPKTRPQPAPRKGDETPS